MNEPDRGTRTGTVTGPGSLVLVATPIGNLADLSPRAAQALLTADVVAAEDTRHTGRLLQHARETAGMDADAAGPRLVSYHEHNERSRAQELLAMITGGATVAVASDAGTPGVADPGYRLVAAAVAEGVTVTAVPGPSAVLQALLLSGLPTDRFAFEGFLPRKQGARSRHLASVAGDARTLVFYVAPHRAADELEAMAAAFGPDRGAALARELTKRFEEVWRGTLGELAERAKTGVKGEVTVVVAGADSGQDERSIDELVADVNARIAEGSSRRDAVADVAAAAGVSRRELYQAALET